jgi:glycosyltransferase involved in cell wall biosynthesis
VVLGPRTLLPLYNPETIVEAFALVADEFPDARLVLLSLFTSDFGLADRIDPARVHLAGRIDHDVMADYFRAADVCVSIPSSDGSPRTVWEALACGCPAIVSDLPWVEGMIVAGRDALVVPIQAESVAAAIRLTLREPDVAERLSINGRALAVASQGKDSAMRNLADLYLSVLGRPT